MNNPLYAAILNTILIMGAGAAAALPATAAEQTAAQTYDIPAGELDSALQRWARQSGQQLLYAGGLVAGKRSDGLSGSYVPGEALRRLLLGSGLKPERLNPKTLVLKVVPIPAGPAASIQPDAVPPEVTELERLTVTGTRIRGADVSSPVVTITQEQMRLAGHTNLGEALRVLPQNFSGGQNPGVAAGASLGGISNQNITSGSGFNLRGLGPDATLTLLNGARMPYDGPFQAIDVFSIPVAAVDRVEVLLDGASAIYGSDAVGGVVNVILKRDYLGGEISARHGWTADGGYEQSQYTAVAGTAWDSGGFIVTGDVLGNSEVRAGQRDYLAKTPHDSEIYPRIDQKSVVLSGYQELGNSAEILIDAYYADRDGHQWIQSSLVSKTLQRTGAKSRGINPALVFYLPNEMSLRLQGAFGKNESRYGNNFFSLDTGLQTSLYHEEYVNKSESAGLELEGRLGMLPGGTARFSAGAGYRKSGFTYMVQPSGGVIDDRANRSRYAYGEVDLPLIGEDQDIPLVRRLVLNGALRYENYDTFGETTTPRIGMIWGVADGFEVKATWGRSFKAPTLIQQYQAGMLYLHPGALYAGAPDDSTILLTWGGNESLEPERAEVRTVGFDFRPVAVPGLTLGFNWFDIDYRDRVVQPNQIYTSALVDPASADFVTIDPTAGQLDAVFSETGLLPGEFSANNGNPDYSPRPYDPADVYAIVRNRYVNAASTRIRGTDLSVHYAMDVWGGQLAVDANGGWIVNAGRRITALAPETPGAGIIYFPARFKGRLGASWSRDGFTASSAVNHISGVTNNLLATPIKGGSMTTLDLVLDYRADFSRIGEVGFNLGITNLFDRHPPYAQPSLSGYPSYDSTNYSALGRIVSVSLTKRF